MGELIRARRTQRRIDAVDRARRRHGRQRRSRQHRSSGVCRRAVDAARPVAGARISARTDSSSHSRTPRVSSTPSSDRRRVGEDDHQSAEQRSRRLRAVQRWHFAGDGRERLRRQREALRRCERRPRTHHRTRTVSAAVAFSNDGTMSPRVGYTHEIIFWRASATARSSPATTRRPAGARSADVDRVLIGRHDLIRPQRRDRIRRQPRSAAKICARSGRRAIDAVEPPPP